MFYVRHSSEILLNVSVFIDYDFLSFFFIPNLTNAMKLFLQPKNMIGNAQNIEIRNVAFNK